MGANELALTAPAPTAKHNDESDSNSSNNHVQKRGLIGTFKAFIKWYSVWALPGMGMFSEAYIIFSAGQIGVFQQVMWPTCYKTYVDCEKDMVQHLAGYIQICGIMAGMLLWGFIGDWTGRKWGSRCVAAIMLSGCIMLTFTPWAPSAYGYFAYFMTSQTWYGFGVGGEYPMASSSAAELSAVTPELRKLRGRQVVLVFSNQGMGNWINAIVILISMAIFGQTGPQKDMTFTGSQHVLALTYGFGAVACVVMVAYRFIYLEESKLFKDVSKIEEIIADRKLKVPAWKLTLRKHMVSAYYYWPRQVVASGAWICNDFAFYGNKLQQGLFIGLLFPTATPYKKQQWTVLNNFIALTGYYTAAWLVDKRWYGRLHMQNVGFVMMFVFYIIIYAQWENMGAKGAPEAGVKAFQALYYLSSYFNQFGPNCTTWLVAGEMFPTDIRATYHGVAACMGKLGAIIAGLWISYISDKRKVFLVSAIWGIGGAVITTLLMNDTTGLDIEEYDRLQRYVLEGRFHEYHGEAVNPRHLSLFERFVLKWGRQYDPELDKQQFEKEIEELRAVPEAVSELHRMNVVDEETFQRASLGAGAKA